MKGHLLSWKLHGIFHPHNFTKPVWVEKLSWFSECVSKSQGLSVYLSVAGIQLWKGCMLWHPWAAVGHISSMGSMCPNHGLLWKMEHTCNAVSSFVSPGCVLAPPASCGTLGGMELLCELSWIQGIAWEIFHSGKSSVSLGSTKI